MKVAGDWLWLCHHRPVGDSYYYFVFWHDGADTSVIILQSVLFINTLKSVRLHFIFLHNHSAYLRGAE